MVKISNCPVHDAPLYSADIWHGLGLSIGWIRDAKIPGFVQSFTPGIFWKFQSRDFFAHDPGILSMYLVNLSGQP